MQWWTGDRRYMQAANVFAGPANRSNTDHPQKVTTLCPLSFRLLSPSILTLFIKQSTISVGNKEQQVWQRNHSFFYNSSQIHLDLSKSAFFRCNQTSTVWTTMYDQLLFTAMTLTIRVEAPSHIQSSKEKPTSLALHFLFSLADNLNETFCYLRNCLLVGQNSVA